MLKPTYANELKQKYKNQIEEAHKKQLNEARSLSKLYVSTVLVDIWELMLRYPNSTVITVIYKERSEFEATVFCDGVVTNPEVRRYYEDGCFGDRMQAFEIAAKELEKKNISFSKKGKGTVVFCWTKENSTFSRDYAELTKGFSCRSLEILSKITETLRESFNWKTLYRIEEGLRYENSSEIWKNEASASVNGLDEEYFKEEINPVIPILTGEGIIVTENTERKDWEFYWTNSVQHDDGTFASELDRLWSEKSYQYDLYLTQEKKHTDNQVKRYARIIRNLMRSVGKKYKTEGIVAKVLYSSDVVIKVYSKESAKINDPIVTKTIPQHGGIEYQQHVKKALEILKDEGALVETEAFGAKVIWQTSGRNFANLYGLYESHPKAEYSLDQEYMYYLMVKSAFEEAFRNNVVAKSIFIKVHCDGRTYVYTPLAKVIKFDVRSGFDFEAFENARKRLAEEGVTSKVDNGVLFKMEF